jgi:4-hydroxy-4-methyl-2-oxoglutarate aldolase
MLHQAVAIARPGDILVATVEEHLLAGAWGEILTVAAQARAIAGLVIDGAVRDIEPIARLGFPIFSRGICLGSCTKIKSGTLNRPIELGGVRVRPGDIVAGDADGVVVIACEEAPKVYEQALRRRQDERVMIEELRQGKTTLELLGLERLLDI